MAGKDTYIQKMETQLTEWREHLEEVEAAAEGREELEDLVQEAMDQEEEVRDLVEQLRGVDEDEFEEKKVELGDASQQLQAQIERINDTYQSTTGQKPPGGREGDAFDFNASRGIQPSSSGTRGRERTLSRPGASKPRSRSRKVARSRPSGPHVKSARIAKGGRGKPSAGRRRT